jgi:hypothetical protein
MINFGYVSQFGKTSPKKGETHDMNWRGWSCQMEYGMPINGFHSMNYFLIRINVFLLSLITK